MKKKKPTKAKRKLYDFVELEPYDWGVICEALKNEINRKRERFFYGVRRMGSEHRFRDEMEYMDVLLSKIHELSRREPVPRILKVKFPML